MFKGIPIDKVLVQFHMSIIIYQSLAENSSYEHICMWTEAASLKECAWVRADPVSLTLISIVALFTTWHGL